MRFNRRQQTGIALLMAILVVVAATAISVSMIHDESFLIRKTSRIQLADRASQYGMGLEDYARVVLVSDFEKNKLDSLEDDWAVGLPYTPIEAGSLAGLMADEQARFNLNSLLTSKLNETRFRRLCDNLSVDTEFIPALMDWIDADSDIRFPGGAEDESYDTYRVANRPMVDVSELLLVKYVKYEDYTTLLEHITVLPSTAGINVNTVSEAVFLMLHDKLTFTDYEKELEKEIFSSVDDFVTRMAKPINPAGLSVNSQYFRATGLVVQGDLEFSFQTLLHRDANGATKVIDRKIGLF